MNLLFEKPEPLVVAGANWPVLEYLIERFNRPGLEGHVLLRRTPLLREMQLCFSAECGGKIFSIVSETFDDVLLTGSDTREQLVQLVSRFLLKAKRQHAEHFIASPSALATRVADGL